MLMASIELFSILAGLGWVSFNLGRWVERKKQVKLQSDVHREERSDVS